MCPPGYAWLGIRQDPRLDRQAIWTKPFRSGC